VSYSVTIKNGLADVALPSGVIGQGSQTYTLTDEQYLELSPTASAALFSSAVHTGGGGGSGDMLSTNNLSDVASSATSRTNLGLGGAAVLAVGATTGTVAAGDDSRVTGAAQKASNLSDVANAGTARTNLGLTAIATAAFGTGSGQVAQGNDSRIIGAAQKASNLSDLANAGTARTNLGLGGAAVLNVGTSAGTVAAGDAVGTAVQTLSTPAGQGLKGWTFDPMMISSSGSAPAAGVVVLSAIQVYSSFTSTNFYWSVATLGSGLTASQNFVGLFDSGGNLVWSVGVDANATSTGLKTETMAIAITPGKYWGAALFNGTTPPALARCGAVAGSTAAINLNLTGSGLKSATNGSARTALPNPITLSANAAGTSFWFAIQ
jgi:hypothetical protein